MKAKTNLFSLSRNPDSLLAAILGFILIQLFSKHSGIGISPDSVTYLSASRHLLTGGGFRSFDNLPTVDFPFFYPFFLTFISFFTGLDPMQFGPVLNGILFSLLIYTAGSIMNGFHQTTGWYKRILLTCVLLSPALQEVYSLLWSETVFLILILIFIIFISTYLRYPNRKWLILSAGICALSCITRYASVFLILTGLILIIANSNESWRKRWQHSLIFGIISGSLLSVNIIRNLWLTGLATGPRPGNHAGISSIAENFGGVLCDWLLLPRNSAIAVVLTVIVILVFAFSWINRFKNRKSGPGFEYVIAVTGFVYCLFMIFTSALTRYEQFTNRLLSPMLIPLLWSISCWIPGFVAERTGRMKGVIVFLALLLSAWFLDIQLKADYEYYDGVKDAGIPGYQEDEVTKSDIVQWLQKNKSILDKNAAVFSNAGDAYYFFTGQPAKQLPFIEFPTMVQKYYGQVVHSGGREYLVWFNDLDNPEMPDLDSILQNKNLMLLQQLRDGSVYATK
jgi:hypothetical protein